MTRDQYIKKFDSTAIYSTMGTGLFPSVMIAQGILESSDRNGKVANSILAREYHNHFGIKASKSWEGDTVSIRTGEYIAGQYKTIKDEFRAYKSPKESFKDRVKFLQENPRYTKGGVFTANSPQAQAWALQNSGYATSPTYAKTLINLIEKHDLEELDTRQNRIKITRNVSIVVGIIAIAIALVFYLLNQ